ncbi:hypothetical protein MtrunA17_Chr4g0024551 [Medicago truncatula]|uniref:SPOROCYTELESS-like EAR-containing protein n=1 Tax=Medicago truncatula TaxID=3880 RepID=A0A396I7V0_MEDTR|nr:hypothetical protein MtrunA17_Chr4g0024551 [Medicago truncatula]
MGSNPGNTGASGCGSGDGNGDTMCSSGLKKQHQEQQKRPRVPKRGPGIAELEKLLREKELTRDRGNNEEFSVSSEFFNRHQPSSSLPWPNSSNLQSHVPSAPKFDQIVPPTPSTIGSMYGNTVLPYIDPIVNTNTHSVGRNGGGGGSGEYELFPMNLKEVGDGSQSDPENSPSRSLASESNHGWSYPANIQKRNNGYPPKPMMNQTLASSGSLSTGLHNHLEPSSIQNSNYNYSYMSQAEHKMVGTKRSHTSSLDNSLIRSRNECHGVISNNPTKYDYRNAEWGSSLELGNKRFNSDKVSPEVQPPSPPMHLFQNDISKGYMFPCQVIEVS